MSQNSDAKAGSGVDHERSTARSRTRAARDASVSPGDGWTRQRVELSCASGVRRAVGWTHPSAPGVAVTRTVGGPGFRVSHLDSGCALGGAISDTPEQAGKIARSLAAVVDFRLDARTLALPDNIARLRETERAACDALGLPLRGRRTTPEERAAEWMEMADRIDAMRAATEHPDAVDLAVDRSRSTPNPSPFAPPAPPSGDPA